MSAAHTPGPWSYVRNPENTRWIIDSAPSHAIACTAGYEPDNEANARLITAAPELLEAAKWAADNYENININHVDYRVEVKRRMDDAIAKARGQ